MNSPLWISENVGDSSKKPGLPYQDPEKFNKWLADNIGSPDEVLPILFGLTVDCCVLSVVQELFWRGYQSFILREGVDAPSGKAEDRDIVLKTTASNWAKTIEWKDLKEKLS